MGREAVIQAMIPELKHMPKLTGKPCRDLMDLVKTKEHLALVAQAADAFGMWHTSEFRGANLRETTESAVRWEAAKGLVLIFCPKAMPLVYALALYPDQRAGILQWIKPSE